MTAEVLTLLTIVSVAIVLFSIEAIPSDIVGLGVMASLVVTGVAEPDVAFSGFGNETFILIFGLLVMSAGLIRTGVVDMAGDLVIRRAGDDPDRLLLIVMISVASFSAFISNTAAAAFFLPVVFGVATKAKQSPSRFLMPLAFASIVTSSVTLVSTSTNILVSGVMSQHGLERLSMFELSPVGIPIAVIGLLYMWFIGRHLVPDRSTADPTSVESLGLRPYLTEVVVLPESPLIGQTLEQSGLGKELDLNVVQIVRERGRHIFPWFGLRLQEDDILIVEAKRDDILKVKDKVGIDLRSDVKLPTIDGEEGELALVEAVLLPGSLLIGRTLAGLNFREQYNLLVVGIDRPGERIRSTMSSVLLRTGDVLLILGNRGNLQAMEDAHMFRILSANVPHKSRARRAKRAIAVFALALAAGTAEIVPLSVAMLIGAIMVVLLRCLTPEEAYHLVEWKVLILIGSMLGLGAAMQATGTDRFLAGLIVEAAGGIGPQVLLAGFFLLTLVLTQPMSNQAAAVVVVPVAIQTALDLGLNPRSFVVMIAVAASCSYLTPLEPACLMVYGPGKYKFMDFARVGLGLTLLIFGLAMGLVPFFWPLTVS